MTDKIKSAREALEMWADDVYDRTSHELLDTHAKTILKALSAYEKLQGVDLDGMKKQPRVLFGITRVNSLYDDGYNQAIDDVKARLIADIGGK